MQQAHLRSFQLLVQATRQQLTIQEMSVAGKVPETIGQVI